MQEIDHQPNLESNHASKKRKMGERVVVAVKIKENDKKQQRNEGPPSDCWSWRKYGQKPIKGSPYPRCSTSKGCSAKKQVERCKTDASMLIITYTSTHNHPGPDFSLHTKQKQETNSVPESSDQTQPTTPKQEHEHEQEQEQETETMPQETPQTMSENHEFQYSQSPFNSTPDHTSINQENHNPFQETANVVVYSEDPKPFCDDNVGLSMSSLLKPEENDFYDELEELPTSSFFTAFMRSSFCEERIAVNLS